MAMPPQPTKRNPLAPERFFDRLLEDERETRIILLLRRLIRKVRKSNSTRALDHCLKHTRTPGTEFRRGRRGEASEAFGKEQYV